MSTAAHNASPTRLPQLSRPPLDTEGNRPEKSRRRSLLPQRTVSGGRTRTLAEGRFHIAESASPTEEETEESTSQWRTAEEADPGHDDEVARQRKSALGALTGELPAEHATAGRTLKVPTKSAVSGAASGLARATSLRKPTAPTGGSRMAPPSAAASAVSRSHLRHASASASSSRPSSRSSGGTASSGRPPSASSIARSTGTRTDVFKRAGSVSESSRIQHIRAPSAASALQGKPQFSTYQQHYSPKKNVGPKPLTSTFLPAASATQRHATPLEPPSAETALQQAELLQLHLTHSQAVACLSRFTASAEGKLRRRFEAVRAKCEAVQAREREARAARNITALKDWGSHEKLQVLSDVLRELSALQGDGPVPGRFDKVVQAFAEWFDAAQGTWESRELNQDFGVVEPLSEQWHAEAGIVDRKVKHLLAELGSLDAPSPDSSAAEVVDTAKASLSLMGEEVRAMRALGVTVMEKESAWVDRQIETVTEKP